MELIVRGKTFRIDFVSNYVHEKYSELTELSYDLVKQTDTREVQELMSTDMEKAKELSNTLEENRKKYTKELILLRREIIREIIESNNIEYDEAWWTKKTSPDDINTFMLDCIRKDLSGKKEVKKK